MDRKGKLKLVQPMAEIIGAVILLYVLWLVINALFR